MNKLQIAVICIVILLTGMTGWYILKSQRSNQSTSITPETPSLTQSPAISLSTPTPPATDSHASKYNIDPYFSITYPTGWGEYDSACPVNSNTFVAFLGIKKQLSNGTAKIDICVYPVTSQSGTTFSFKSMKARTQLNETQDQYETHNTNQVISGNKAYITDNILDLRNSDTPGLSAYTKDMYILHGNYLYLISLSLGLSNRTDNIYTAKQDIMSDVNMIVNSLSFHTY